MTLKKKQKKGKEGNKTSKRACKCKKMVNNSKKRASIQ